MTKDVTHYKSPGTDHIPDRQGQITYQITRDISHYR